MKGRRDVGCGRKKLPLLTFRRPPPVGGGASHHPATERKLVPPAPGCAVQNRPPRARLSSGQLGMDLGGLRAE
eukprot:12098224-Alexandrium_andersonii.AAC.1